MNFIGKKIGNYIVKQELGTGGMGAVYLCEHPLLGRHVALKVLHEEYARDPSTVERFFNEAKAANAIRHANIVDISDFGWVGGEDGQPATVYLVMELLAGKSLGAALPSLSIEETLHVTRQCCRALAASHQRGIVHRDLKPENIFLIERNADPLFVKILDFGIAKLLNPGEGARTQIGAILGTPSYMSPEQCEGLGRVDHRADIYSLGVVLYEMLTKRLPFHAESFAQLAIAHMTQAPAPPSRLNPRVTPELDAVVLRAMEKSPARRFQTMDELLAAIDDAGKRQVAAPAAVAAAASAAPAPLPLQETLQHAAAQVGGAVPAPSRRRGGRAIAAAVAVAAVIAGTVIAIVARRPAPTTRPVAVAEPATARPPAPPPPAPAAAAPAPPASPATVAVTIETQPPGAIVTRGGVRAGVTPLTMEVAKGGPALELDIAHDGFTAEHRVVTLDAPSQLLLTLQPVAAEKPAPPRRTVRRVSSELKPL